MSRQSDMQRLEELLAELRDVALRLGAIQHWDGDASYLHYSLHLTIPRAIGQERAAIAAPQKGEGRGDG